MSAVDRILRHHLAEDVERYLGECVIPLERVWAESRELHNRAVKEQRPSVLRRVGYALGIAEAPTPEDLEIADEDLPDLDDSQFPPEAQTDEDRRRYRLCYAIAQAHMGDLGEADTFQMARSLYRNPAIPTA